MSDLARSHLLGLIRRPDAFTVPQTAALMSEILGMAHADAMLRVVREPPSILALGGNDDRMQRTVDLIGQGGGEAFVCAVDDLNAIGPATVVRDLSVGPGTLTITTHGRTEIFSLPNSSVRVLVRGRARERRAEIGRTWPDPLGSEPTYRVRIPGGAWMTLPATRIAGERERGEAQGTFILTELLDVHVLDANGSMRLLRIDGRRFAYAALGAMRQYTDRINMDLMTDLLRHLAPEEIVDDAFDLWREPLEQARIRYPFQPTEPAMRGFDLYSRWVRCMYRHLAHPC